MSKYSKLAERLERFRPGPDDHYLYKAATALRELEAQLLAEREANDRLRIKRNEFRAERDRLRAENDALHNRMGYWRERSGIFEEALRRIEMKEPEEYVIEDTWRAVQELNEEYKPC